MTETECIALKFGMFLFYAGSVRPTQTTTDENRLLCSGANNQSYICESGHCCGEAHCCTHFYELWWFWLVWVIIILLSCCCICHHRRSKHRLQQQQRQHEINLIAYREARSYASLPFYFRFLPNYLLPDYEEVVNRPPTPPPPYSPLSGGGGGQSPEASPLTAETPDGPHPLPQSPPPSPDSGTPSSEELRPQADGKPPAPEEDPSPDPATPPRDRLGRESPGDPEKERLRNCGPEDKEGATGRHRRFTGDSGIEVCVCIGDPGTEGGHRDLEEGLLGDFCHGCDSCSRSSARPGDEEQAPERRPDHGAAPVPRSPVGLLLHTIREQEASHQHGNLGPQS